MNKELTIFNELNKNNLAHEFTYNEQLQAIKIRNRIVADSDFKDYKYLLPIEISSFIKAELDSNKRLFYVLLYATGARISELLRIKSTDIKIEDDFSYIKLHTAKMNAKGRTKTIKDPIRIVDIEISIANKIKSFVYTNKIKEYKPIFEITSRTAENWCKATQKALKDHYGVTLPFDVTPKVFRHSFAINHLYSGTDIKIISKYLGHKRFKTTEIYTNILAIETALKRQHIKFDV